MRGAPSGRAETTALRRREALQTYLRKAVTERRSGVAGSAARTASTTSSLDPTAPESLFDQAARKDAMARYRAALDRLALSDQELLVARLELGYTYEQIALARELGSSDAARIAICRALLRLAAELISG